MTYFLQSNLLVSAKRERSSCFFYFYDISVIRIKLRRVTTASYLPEFKIGSQQNVNEQDGAEVAGEALEMAEFGRG